MNITLLIPVLNEIEGMKVIMPRVNSNAFTQILVLDGGSTDGTVEWSQEQGYEVHVQTKPGIRHAYNEVLAKIRGDILITFSPDGNSVPELLPDLIMEMEKGFDMVIISRYLGDAVSEDDDIITRFGNWLFTRTVNLLFNARYTDVMVIYRAYKTQVIYDLELDKDAAYITPETLFHTRISWEPLLSVRAAKRNLKIGEIPGDEPPRIGGERKLQRFKWGAAYYFQFIREKFFWK